MSDFSILLNWQRTTPDFEYKTFNRDHTWRLAGGQVVRGSAAAEYSGDPEMSNPEEALLAALSSCHMLTFLSIAALKKLVVESYEDEPLAELGKNEKGKMMVSHLTLRPRVVFSADTTPDPDTVRELHRKAKENCFIGNSLLSSVTLEPRF
ncbi:MAG TPA: OsmC family protein [Candidatus Competibacteraceae bacterium]|nr:MAG: OsmC family peroxiredoxin [Candidatus Competibacteraceae bacterium]HOB61986.1 OsmC family protein [Candidatus Competibacteraceae bacterium]HQA26085.1 OsmC family protein [Candidatus Competibacteraceae bacterium]HQD55258.1 OsmC family protein [Candidatus Competibacteraceae bacterium]